MALPVMLAFGLGLWPGPVPAGYPTRAVAERQAEMDRMAEAMRVLGRFLKGEAVTAAEIAAGAGAIHRIAAGLAAGLFPEGTAIGVGNSAARPEIWQEWDLFGQYATDLRAAAVRLAAVAATGDVRALREPVVAVVRACGACHELFRKKP